MTAPPPTYQVRLRSSVSADPDGILIEGDLEPFQVVSGTRSFRISPEVEDVPGLHVEWHDGPDGATAVPHHHDEPRLRFLTAETEVTLHPKRELAPDDKARLRQDLVQVLQRTLSHLRVLTNDIRIDPHAPARSIPEYFEPEEQDWTWFSYYVIQVDDLTDPISGEVWSRAGTDVERGRDTQVHEELFLEALAFRDMGNSRMAVLCAAIAAEACTFRMLANELTRGRVSRDRAEKFITGLSRRSEQPVLFEFFDLIPQELMAPLDNLFGWRNNIAHGGARKLTPIERADKAIDTARRVRSAFERHTATPSTPRARASTES